MFRHLIQGKSWLCLALITLISVSSWPEHVIAQDKITTEKQPLSSSNRIFTHPQQKFTVYIPDDAQVMNTVENADLIMQSLSGWIINIQSSPANQSINLGQIAGHFESKYVGSDKPWTQKLSGNIVDSDTYSGQYAGSGSRLQVVIKRTPFWDFALMFMAPDNSFISASEVFRIVLNSFHPQMGNDDQRHIGDVTAAANQPDINEQGTNATLSQQYHDPSLGYEISYPTNWEVKKPDDYTVIFSGRAGTEENYVAVSIRNIAMPQSATPMIIAEGMLQQIQTQMAYTESNVRHERSIEITIGQGDEISQGMQMLSTFSRGQIEYRQWSFAVVRPAVNIIHAWTYTAPLDRFHKYQGITERMAGSITFIPSTPQ